MRWRVMAFFAVALGVSYLFARQITRPVEQMRAAARRFAGGDLRARVGPQQYQAPELRELATDFDEMASRIESLVLSQKRLLSDVSHELRSPLARLSLAVGLARRSANPETTTSLDRIETEADNLNRLIGRVLQLSRLEAGAAVRNEPVSLSGVLWEIVNNANFEAAHGKRVKLDAERSYEIDGDRELLASAIENVVRNGLHYTAPCSEVEVHLTGQGITVRDHGPGVKPEKLRAIFEPFYRLEAGRETRSGGVGLGLAIARRAILAHHGEIAARNHPEGGLEVEIRLPGLRA
jgi:two-component system sensor histidine kinase CpxA